MTEPNLESNMCWVPALLQVSDPLFPTGAYAHSLGLEQWAAHSGYTSGEDLVTFFNEHAGPSLERLELPYLRFARSLLTDQDFIGLIELEQEINAWKWASEIREASMAQGRGRLRLLSKLWNEPGIGTYKKALAQGDVYGHHLCVTALQFEVLNVPGKAGLLSYGYHTLANYVSASVKLLRISPEAAQKALHSGLELLPHWVENSHNVERENAGWFAPAFDICCARHTTAFSRLFIS